MSNNAALPLQTKQQFLANNPAFTPGSLNWLLFHRNENGLSRAVIRVGRRLLIDTEEFRKWVENQRER